ncbi:MAG TPA: DUF6496 domain-containing protein [Candidatus Paceibacterota bacterium]
MRDAYDEGMAAKKSIGRSTRKYSRGASRKVGEALHKYKHGELKGGRGKRGKAKSRKQAVAIGLSEARRAGEKVPPPPRRSRKK